MGLARRPTKDSSKQTRHSLAQILDIFSSIFAGVNNSAGFIQLVEGFDKRKVNLP